MSDKMKDVKSPDSEQGVIEGAGGFRRSSPPNFTCGFRFSEFNKELCVVDFLDNAIGNSELYIFGSIGLTRSTAKQLLDGLKKFVGDEK